MWDLQFDENGNLTSPAAGDFLAQVAAQDVQDLFMFSHGWDTSAGDAQALYNAMFPLIRTAAQGYPAWESSGSPGSTGRRCGSRPPRPLRPPRAAPRRPARLRRSALSAGTAAVTGAEIAASLAPGFTDAAQQKTITQIGQLIDDGQAMAEAGQTDEAKQGQLTQIGQLIKSLTPQPPPGGQ